MQELTESSLKAAKEYVDLIFKGAVSELGGILTDSIGYWRLQNRVRLLLKAKSLLSSNGINPSQIGPSVIVPILEDGSMIEDEKLSDMFAGLLASHLDGKQSAGVHPSYSKVLAQLSPLDASVLAVFRKYTSYAEARDLGLRGGPLSVENVSREGEFNQKQCYLSCLNLGRLGLIDHMGFEPPEGHPVSNIFSDSPEHQMFRVTEYAVEFLQACSYQIRA